MIIESVFYKLPYYLFKKENEPLFEIRLVSYFLWVMFLELQSMGINEPFLVQVEKKYTNSPDNSKKADIYVEIPWLKSTKSEEPIKETAKHYYVFEKNWIEVKSFSRKDIKDIRKRRKITVTKTENAGSVINDLLRLKYYAPNDSGKYLLLCFDNHPEKYLAFGIRSGKKRAYLKELLGLEEGIMKNKISFDITNEPKSFKNKLDEEFRDIKIVELNVITLKIEPKNIGESSSEPYFWLYLIKILPDENNEEKGSRI
jgi:hypothetical protein